MGIHCCQRQQRTCLWHLLHSHKNGMLSPSHPRCRTLQRACRHRRSSGRLQEDIRLHSHRCRRCLRPRCNCLHSRIHKRAWHTIASASGNARTVGDTTFVQARRVVAVGHTTFVSTARIVAIAHTTLVNFAVQIPQASTRPVIVGGFWVVVASGVVHAAAHRHELREVTRAIKVDRFLKLVGPISKREHLIVEGARNGTELLW